MGLLNRKSRAERLAEKVAESVLEKAGITPAKVAAVGGSMGPALQGAPANLSMLAQGTAMSPPLGRALTTYNDSLGPASPFVPIPLDYGQPGTGRPAPRKYQYDVAENLSLVNRLASWNLLTAAATQCDIVARCITIRALDTAKKGWTFNVTKDAIARIMQQKGVSQSQAAKIARDQNLDQITQLSEFWENPYPQTYRGFREWITEAMWQIMVYDGLPIVPCFNLGGDVIGFEIVTASTVKILLNNFGQTPTPPDPAYQQVLWGFPRGEFVSGPMKGEDKTFIGGEFNVQERDMMHYFVMNRRTWTPYGYSPVEQALPMVNLYMNRQKWLNSEYEHGTSAKVYMKALDTGDLTWQNYADWERVLNDYMEGQTQTRHLTKITPFEPVFAPEIDERYKGDYDEEIRKWIASIFGVSAQQVGVIPRAGMGGGKGAAEGQQDDAETISSKPMDDFITEFINALGRAHLGQTRDVTFTLVDDKGAEEGVEIAQAGQVFVSAGLKTRNEWREENGLPPVPEPEADQLSITTATGVQFLKGLLEEAEAAGQPTEGEPDGEAPQVPQGQDQEGEDSPDGDKGGAPQAGVDEKAVDAELRKFTQFVARCQKSGRWRTFEFATLPEDVGNRLNETGYFIAKGAREWKPGWAQELVKAGLAPRPKGR